MKNLAKITNYYNKKEAWNDWMNLANEVIEAGYPELVEKYKPDKNSGWRKIDKQSALLKEIFIGIKFNSDE